ncbi:MAG: hypothetical protein J1D88_03630 [Treponema sp.]|nr:hypothetical protein [Treponema sp.]
MKRKLAFLAIFVVLGMAAFAQQTVQVDMPKAENLPRDETVWLPGQIQDKLKSNLQEYLGWRTVVDSASEAIVKQLQRESEDAGRNESEAIPAGNLSTAKFAVLARIRKTGKGYTISVDYTDIEHGIQETVTTSKEYKSAEALYENTGAIDEITLALAERLNIAINPIQKQALQYGTADFSIDDQLALARQNEEQYKRMMEQFDEELRALSVSSDPNAVENTKKIEAEKALLAEKQRSEQRRLAELAEQKKQAAEDALKEAKRTDELKKERDKLAADVAKKAAKVREQKINKQSVLGQIGVIESKKKALIEIRQSTEARIEELRNQAEKDKADERAKILSKEWNRTDLENGVPTTAAQTRREKRIEEYIKKRDASLEKEMMNVRAVITTQESDLLAEIRRDQKKIAGIRTVSSLGDELKVSYGDYSGANNGWNAYLSLYSDGVLLFQDKFLLDYKAVTGKNAPNPEADDDAWKEYDDTVEMYNSLLLRGDPILYYEIDYTVTAAPDNEPSKYTFTFKNIRIINNVTKNRQTNVINQNRDYTMSPSLDIRTKKEVASHIAKENRKLAEISAKKERMEAQKGFYHELGGGGLGGLGLDFTYIALASDYKLMGGSAYLDIALRSWMFLDFGAGVLSGFSDNIQDPPTFLSVYGGIGVNRRIHIFKWHPAVYCLFDIGGIISGEDGKENIYGEENIYIDHQFFLKQSVGLVLPLLVVDGGLGSLDLAACYSMMLFPGIPKFSDSFSIGLRYTFHFN